MPALFVLLSAALNLAAGNPAAGAALASAAFMLAAVALHEVGNAPTRDRVAKMPCHLAARQRPR